MKLIQLQTQRYQHLEAGFKEWLTILQHHHTTIEGAPVKVREFLHWLEEKEINLKQLTKTDLQAYITYLSHRKNQRRQGGLSAGYLNMHIRSLKQFSEYLQQSREQGFTVEVSYYKPIRQRDILTVAEIKALYEATTPDAVGLRDRAILGIYYGCGLRRSEGTGLDVEDLMIQKQLLYVRKGKNYKERYVPITAQVLTDLVNYLEFSRPYFGSGQSLLLSNKGRISGSGLMHRLKTLKTRANITKTIGLHTLRHSIATHLLKQGMKLSDISSFLGHHSIESTQLYTHLLDETLSEGDEQ